MRENAPARRALSAPFLPHVRAELELWNAGNFVKDFGIPGEIYSRGNTLRFYTYVYRCHRGDMRLGRSLPENARGKIKRAFFWEIHGDGRTMTPWTVFTASRRKFEYLWNTLVGSHKWDMYFGPTWISSSDNYFLIHLRVQSPARTNPTHRICLLSCYFCRVDTTIREITANG